LSLPFIAFNVRQLSMGGIGILCSKNVATN
jgi:hypothetical protein